ncbi:hypothetical protein MX633_03210 [Carnobacterium divergens]|jgi:hypothetical protein|uniref:hypothetical protein n=1 Tax=Carnobacterium divergens TaxID=2748 RepID=UPI0028927218|nr:hypothetical protein [Carnobacterium divergens]MDT1995679.1 hypothetical protein [Carnobacterium divergens]
MSLPKKYRVIDFDFETSKDLQDILNGQLLEGYVYKETMGLCMVFEYDVYTECAFKQDEE